MSFKVIVFILTVFTSCNSDSIQNLGGEWLLKEAKGRYVDLKATVPGGIYTDLMNNNIIDDIFYGNNDETTKWVPRSDWTYYTTFTVSNDLLFFENINIVFDGLDTFANIILNDVKVGESENMFVQYTFDIKKHLKSGENKIEVQFLSPIEVGENLAREQNKTYNIPVNCPPAEYRGDCYVNMIRKMQASYSWDWGPSFPSVGIWKDLYIEAYNESTIRYVVTDVVERENSWELNIDTYFANNAKRKVVGRASYQMTLNTISVTRLVQVTESPNEYNEIVLSTTIPISKNYVSTWWPNGYGAHDLYDLTVTFSNEDQTESSTKTVRVGFRTIEVVQDPVQGGLTFYFKINGVPIFAKGSNEIPIDILPERGQDKATVLRVLRDAEIAHMNMLRVWGGGVYESDYFYDLADEFGILIWQDFMFACSLYPVNDRYLNTVVDEVRHQTKRLIGHASVAIFSGNNENEGALRDNWYGTQSNFDQYRRDYVKLYIDTIRSEFLRVTHNKGLFISSSPSNGKETDEEGYVAQQPGSAFYGDVHYYNYFMDPFESVVYPIPRFASEYGYQSLPSINSFLTATNTIKDLDINSAFMDHRQHHPQGNQQLRSLIDFELALPSVNSPNYSKAFIYYSQIVHAVSIKIETEHYRRYRGILNNNGQGDTMGALYWQLNDVWVAPTWSSVDYTGRWKILHYYATQFFAPVIITGHLDAARNLNVYIVSDLLSPLEDVTASIQVYKWDSFDPISEEKIVTNLESGKSHLITSFIIDNYLTNKGCGAQYDARRNCFIYLTLYREGVQVGPYNFVLADKVKNSQLKNSIVKIDSVRKIGDEGTFEVDISSDKIALFVWLESGKISGRFSENGFIEVNSHRTVFFFTEENITADELQKELTITHLLDQQYFVN